MGKEQSEFTVQVAGKEFRGYRPEPILKNIDVVPYDRSMDPRTAVDAIKEGYAVLVIDFFSSGITVLGALKKYVRKKYPDKSFQGQREFRDAFRTLSRQILLVVRDQKLTVKKAPDIGWIKILYPDLKEFLLPFTQVQGLNSSWQWYTKGLSIPGVPNTIHPYFGTYFPTRFEHLKLFDHWLKQYKGEKKSAIDVGIGCGVLSFQLLKHLFEKVYGTDTNPNAIIGLHEHLHKYELSEKIALIHGDLFAGCTINTELIVFNPPWLPAPQDLSGLDTAVYYERDLFHRFFEEAAKFLEPGGRVVLLFSNLAQITHVADGHPIKDELSKGGRFEKELLLKKGMSPASKKTKRDQNWRTAEVVELWVLKLKDL